MCVCVGPSLSEDVFVYAAAVNCGSVWLAMTGTGGTDSNECGHCREVNDSSKSNVVTCITCKKGFHTSCVYLGGIKGTNLPHVNWLCNHCADAIRKEPTMKTDGLEELKAQLEELKDLILKGFAEMRGEVNSAVKKSSTEMSVSVEDTVREVVTSAVMNARESMVNGELATEVTDWTEVVKRGNKKKGKNLLVVKANYNEEKATDRKLDIATALTGVPINDSRFTVGGSSSEVQADIIHTHNSRVSEIDSKKGKANVLC
ncbi:hypothetical protein Pcinc_002328 [Petrolisthes cinctipes]|uniref:PHD-type domain-containing protein n=1 Tax=Petrolisthes cinctipes TaxID=88211 RepID=A0AAE1L2D3_PETCI|nr:hypothetical protein Pcinc_002328 [Petrolisthes cinctipes]